MADLSMLAGLLPLIELLKDPNIQASIAHLQNAANKTPIGNSNTNGTLGETPPSTKPTPNKQSRKRNRDRVDDDDIIDKDENEMDVDENTGTGRAAPSKSVKRPYSKQATTPGIRPAQRSHRQRTSSSPVAVPKPSLSKSRAAPRGTDPHKPAPPSDKPSRPPFHVSGTKTTHPKRSGAANTPTNSTSPPQDKRPTSKSTGASLTSKQPARQQKSGGNNKQNGKQAGPEDSRGDPSVKSGRSVPEPAPRHTTALSRVSTRNVNSSLPIPSISTARKPTIRDWQEMIGMSSDDALRFQNLVFAVLEEKYPGICFSESWTHAFTSSARNGILYILCQHFKAENPERYGHLKKKGMGKAMRFWIEDMVRNEKKKTKREEERAEGKGGIRRTKPSANANKRTASGKRRVKSCEFIDDEAEEVDDSDISASGDEQDEDMLVDDGVSVSEDADELEEEPPRIIVLFQGKNDIVYCRWDAFVSQDRLDRLFASNMLNWVEDDMEVLGSPLYKNGRVNRKIIVPLQTVEDVEDNMENIDKFGIFIHTRIKAPTGDKSESQKDVAMDDDTSTHDDDLTGSPIPTNEEHSALFAQIERDVAVARQSAKGLHGDRSGSEVDEDGGDFGGWEQEAWDAERKKMDSEYEDDSYLHEQESAPMDPPSPRRLETESQPKERTLLTKEREKSKLWNTQRLISDTHGSDSDDDLDKPERPRIIRKYVLNPSAAPSLSVSSASQPVSSTVSPPVYRRIEPKSSVLTSRDPNIRQSSSSASHVSVLDGTPHTPTPHRQKATSDTSPSTTTAWHPRSDSNASPLRTPAKTNMFTVPPTPPKTPVSQPDRHSGSIETGTLPAESVQFLCVDFMETGTKVWFSRKDVGSYKDFCVAVGRVLSFDRDEDGIEFKKTGDTRGAFTPISCQVHLAKAVAKCKGHGMRLRVLRHVKDDDGFHSDYLLPDGQKERDSSDVAAETGVLMTGGKTPEPEPMVVDQALPAPIGDAVPTSHSTAKGKKRVQAIVDLQIDDNSQPVAESTQVGNRYLRKRDRTGVVEKKNSPTPSPTPPPSSQKAKRWTSTEIAELKASRPSGYN
ncbi:hypothetical protein BJ508DRAFT_335623 [Ascobolus immersus RN42]|uniref:Uncharacterized protein n=1 Tax=Ascobolus immersus RN42 TaxID=1160509 RepID=A0A3N4HBR2_ASCIM|nr:hypothetical protein BJ508DRAFT_335623 [Ascobolus immersus RN42]